MKKHLYRLYGLDEKRIELITECHRNYPSEDYHGIRTDKRGNVYAVIEATRWRVFKANLIVFMYDLTHRKNRYGLRFKRHKGDFI